MRLDQQDRLVEVMFAAKQAEMPGEIRVVRNARGEITDEAFVKWSLRRHDWVHQQVAGQAAGFLSEGQMETLKTLQKQYHLEEETNLKVWMASKLQNGSHK